MILLVSLGIYAWVYTNQKKHKDELAQKTEKTNQDQINIAEKAKQTLIELQEKSNLEELTRSEKVQYEIDVKHKAETELLNAQERIDAIKKTYYPHFISFIKIKGGSFMMGNQDGDEDEKPVHEVKLKDFYMSKTEVTISQYRECVEAGYCIKPDECDPQSGPNWTDEVGEEEDHPILCVDWHNARIFAKWVGGDLPTEAQWEYASRSRGKKIKYPWGNKEPTCSLMNWECMDLAQPVCSRKGHTDQGLCDMMGNVWEWTLDEWHDSYHDAPKDGRAWCVHPDCKVQKQKERVLRGGAWSNEKDAFLTTARFALYHTTRADRIGFRVVRSIK